MKNIFKRIFNYPLIIIIAFSFSSLQRFFQSTFTKEILNNETYALVNLFLLLITGFYTNIRAFLFFLVFGCQSNVKIEMKKIFFDFVEFFASKFDRCFRFFKLKGNGNTNDNKGINCDYKRYGKEGNNKGIEI